MSVPYQECESCIATQWCKKYSGEVPTPPVPDWCSAKFRLDKALGMANIPKIYRKANIANYKVDKDNKEHYDRIKPFIDHIVEEVDEGTNFFFYKSSPGTGKTFHGACLLNQYIYKTCLTSRFDFENPLAMFVVYADLMDDLRYRRDSEELQQRVEQIKNVPLLLLDDIGSGTTSQFTIEQTYLILNHRFNNGLSTIVTSNMSLSHLNNPQVLGARNVSRIMSNSMGMEIGGSDRRKMTIRRGR